MRVPHVGLCILLLTLLALAPLSLHAQNNPAPSLATLQAQLDALKAEYQTRISDLEKQLQALQAQPIAAPPAQGVTGGSVANSKVFNPDIAVIGNFIGNAGRNRTNPSPSLEAHESEVSFQAIIDPYARADFFMSFGESGVELEEGYITFDKAPLGLLLKIGKQRAAFGKVNSLHSHVLPWADRPLVTNNLVGGEEGISDAGISIARLIPNPVMFLEATAQAYRGDSGDLYSANRKGDLSYVGHLRGFKDITESTNIDLGASYSRGHNNSGIPDFTTTLWGADATLRWKPLQRSIYQSFTARSEFIWSQREQPGGQQNGQGFYVSADYQLARRWFLGGRFDRATQADAASLHDKGGSAILTYRPSEFSQIRGQLRRTNYAGGENANEFLMQFQYVIGAHGAHPF